MAMQNPSPAAGRPAARAAIKPAGTPKRDINLLPANEASERIARRGTIALAVVVGVLLLGYFAVVMPTLQLRSLQALADSKAGEAASMQGVDTAFNKLVAQRNSLNQMLQSLDAFDTGNQPPADIMKQISDACPGSITLLSVTLSADGATIDGRAADDRDIAQLIVNLKTLPQYASVELVSAKDDAENADPGRKRLFELNARLPAPAASASPSPQATPAADTKGGDGQ